MSEKEEVLPKDKILLAALAADELHKSNQSVYRTQLVEAKTYLRQLREVIDQVFAKEIAKGRIYVLQDEFTITVGVNLDSPLSAVLPYLDFRILVTRRYCSLFLPGEWVLSLWSRHSFLTQVEPITQRSCTPTELSHFTRTVFTYLCELRDYGDESTDDSSALIPPEPSQDQGASCLVGTLRIVGTEAISAVS